MTERQDLVVSRETADRLDQFEALLRKWNPAINLVSKASLETLWDRHIRDSAQIFQFGQRYGHWVDLGSGGGFPGLIVAILAAEGTTPIKVTLIESDQRKATFLRHVAATLALPVTVLSQRIELCPPQAAETLSARALAPLATLMSFADRHLAPQGTAIFPKGANWRLEVEAARKDWHFDLTEYPSVTDPEGAILIVKAISHV